MKYLRTGLLSAIIAMSCIATQAQTVDEIIDQYAAAVGGKEKLSQVKTIYMEGSTDIMGNQAPSIIQVFHGTGYKYEMDFNGAKVITCYNDKGGWNINPMAGVTTATAIPEDIAKTGQIQMDATNPFFDYAAKGNAVELIGKEDVNGSMAYKLKVTTKANTEFNYFIDSSTHYLSKMEFIITQGQNITFVYSDYHKTDYGIMMPFTQVVDLAGLVMTTTLKKIEVNKTIDQSVFEMPGK